MNAAQQICAFNVTQPLRLSCRRDFGPAAGSAAIGCSGRSPSRTVASAVRRTGRVARYEQSAYGAGPPQVGPRGSGRTSIATHHLTDQIWYMAIVRSVKSRLRMEAELRASQVRQRAILDALPDMMFAYRATVRSWTSRALRPMNWLCAPKSFWVTRSSKSCPRNWRRR